MRKVEKIKENVLDLTVGLPKEDRKFALDFLRKHVYMDELHEEAIDFFNKKEIIFGVGSKNPTIVVITKEGIKNDQKNRLLNAFNKMGLEDTQVYFATNNFVVTRRYKEERKEFLLRLMGILKPKFVLSFDNIDYSDELEVEYINTALPASVITDKENKDTLAQLNKHFKYLKNIL